MNKFSQDRHNSSKKVVSLGATNDFPIPASEKSIAELVKIAVKRTFGPGETLFWEDDPAKNLFLLLSGSMKGYKLLPNGRSQISRFIHAGNLMAPTSIESYTYSAEALTVCTVLIIPRKRFEAVADNDPLLRHEVMKLVSRELHQSQRQVLLLGRMPAIERVSQFLLDFANAHDQSCGPEGEIPVIKLPMTRTDIADFLGLTIETVSRIFSQFRKEGLIELPKPNLVRFCDPARLQRQAEALAA